MLHQLIDHKEYRYIWLSIQTLLLIAAFGSVDLLKLLVPRWADDWWKPVMALIGGWAVASALLANTNTHRHDFRNDNDPARAAATAIRSPNTCGIAVLRKVYWQFPYALLHENKPVFVIGTEGDLTRSRPALAERGFNVMLSYATDAPPPAPWT